MFTLRLPLSTYLRSSSAITMKTLCQFFFSSSTLHTSRFDISNGSHLNLLDDRIWMILLQQVEQGKFQAVISRPPSSTFKSLELRTPRGPARYGIKPMSGDKAETVRKHNLLLIRALQLHSIVSGQGGIAITLLHSDKVGNSIMLNFDEAELLGSAIGTQTRLFSHRAFGANEGHTIALHNNVDLTDLPQSSPSASSAANPQDDVKVRQC